MSNSIGREADWDHLRSFLAVARGGTFTAAAKALGVKHSTISRHMLELEESIKSKVLTRGSGGLRMTSAGERLLAAAEAMEHQFRLAREDITGRDLLISGTVRIGAPDGFGSLFLAPRLVTLMMDHPALAIQLMAMPRIFNLTKREADIAISLAIPKQGRLITKKLCQYGLSLYASVEYLAANHAIKGLSDLKEHRFINYIDDLIFTSELDYIDEVVPGAQSNFQSSNIIAQAHATSCGYGLCILPYFIAKQYPNLRQVLPAETSMNRTWFMLINEDQKDLSRIRTVSKFLSDQVQANAQFFSEP
jgi:DNA-binding transcriptional LysR family regulator